MIAGVGLKVIKIKQSRGASQMIAFFSSACHFMHSYAFVMPAKGTVRIKFYFFIQTVAIDVLCFFLSVAVRVLSWS